MEVGVISETAEKMSFFEHVFQFDEANKNELFNMIQYAVMAIVPVIVVLKAVKHIFPEEDETKGTLEILVESVGQIVFILSMLWFCDRIIRYAPTYSKTEYPKFSPVSFLLPFLLILMTLQTKLGSKIEILVDRLMDAWHGRDSTKRTSTTNVNKEHIPVQHQPSQADHLDTSQILPQNRELTSMPQTQNAMDQRDFNNMYQNTTTPLQNTDFPTNEILAANDGTVGNFSGW